MSEFLSALGKALNSIPAQVLFFPRQVLTYSQFSVNTSRLQGVFTWCNDFVIITYLFDSGEQLNRIKQLSQEKMHSYEKRDLANKQVRTNDSATWRLHPYSRVKHLAQKHRQADCRQHGPWKSAKSVGHRCVTSALQVILLLR